MRQRFGRPCSSVSDLVSVSKNASFAFVAWPKSRDSRDSRAQLGPGRENFGPRGRSRWRMRSSTWSRPRKRRRGTKSPRSQAVQMIVEDPESTAIAPKQQRLAKQSGVQNISWHLKFYQRQKPARPFCSANSWTVGAPKLRRTQLWRRPRPSSADLLRKEPKEDPNFSGVPGVGWLGKRSGEWRVQVFLAQ